MHKTSGSCAAANILTGEVLVTQGLGSIESNGIGSCIVLAVYQIVLKVGGLAHIMLPGKCQNSFPGLKTRYAYDAIDLLLNKMSAYGAMPERCEACLIGGANVLERPDDTICEANLASTRQYLAGYKIPVVAEAVGGICNRSVRFDINNGEVFFTEGNRSQKLLWRYQ